MTRVTESTAPLGQLSAAQKKQRKKDRQAAKAATAASAAPQARVTTARAMGPTAEAEAQAEQQPDAANGVQPMQTEANEQAQLQQERVNPLDLLGRSPFDLQASALYEQRENGLSPSMELLVVLKQHGADFEQGKRVLDQMTTEEVSAILDPARKAFLDRKGEENRLAGLMRLPNPNGWDANTQELFNRTQEGLDKTPTRVRARNLNILQDPTPPRVELRQNPTAPAAQGTVITTDMVTDPAWLAQTLTGLVQAGRAQSTLGLNMRNAVSPLLHRAGGIDQTLAQAGANIEQQQNELQGMRSDIDTLVHDHQEDTLARCIASTGGAPSGATTGRLSGRQAAIERVDVLDIHEPTFTLRAHHQWLREDGDIEWKVEFLGAHGRPGNVMSFKARLAEWARLDQAAEEMATVTATGSGKVRMQPPAPFSGEGDVEPDLAIMGLENFFSSSGLARNQWGRQVHTMLKGPALKAYSAIAVPLHSATGGQQCPSWDQVRALIASFKSNDTPAMARAQLASIRQTGKVREYIHRFQHLINQVGPDPPAKTDQLIYFLTGLRNAQTLSPAGTAWTSLESAQDFHLQREISELKVQSSRHTTPYEPRLQKPFFKPRLNAIAQRSRNDHYGGGEGKIYGRTGGRPDARGRGKGRDTGNSRGRGRGGRQEHAYGGGEGEQGRQNRERCPDSAYGRNYAELMQKRKGPCPNPAHRHLQEECNAFKRLEQQYLALEKQQQPQQAHGA